MTPGQVAFRPKDREPDENAVRLIDFGGLS